MLMYYAKRTLEILREEGPVGLFERFWMKLLPNKYGFIYKIYKNKVMNYFRYDATAKYKKIIYIDPNKICRNNTSVWITDGLGQIKKGNWDIQTYSQHIQEARAVTGIKQRFQEKKSWENTDYYEMAKERFDRGERVPGAGNIEQLESRFQYLDELFKDIEKDGYKRANHVSKDYKGNYKDDLEVLVIITRNGEIQHRDGIHRFAIALVLDIKIPVQVVCRHKLWQELRDEIHNNGLPEGREDLRDHPDLQDVIDD